MQYMLHMTINGLKDTFSEDNLHELAAKMLQLKHLKAVY